MTKLTYHRRIQLSFLLYIFLPILAVSIFSFSLIRESMIEKVELSNDNFLNVINDEISRMVDDISFSSYYIVNDGGFKQHLQQFSDVARLNSHLDYQTFRKIEDELSLVASKPLNNNIKMFLVNKHDFIISSSSTAEIEPVRQNLQALLDKVDMNQRGPLQWLGMFYDNKGSGSGNDNGKGSYYIARVIYDADNKEAVSILLVTIAAKYFDSLMEPIQFGKAAIYDREGMKITSQEGPALVAEPDSKLGIRSEMLVDKTNWTLVFETSQESLTGSISRVFYSGLAVVVLFFIVFSISSMYIAKRLYTPIQKLQRVVRQFGMGNLDARLEVKGKDDIAELGTTLNVMLDQIKGLIQDIEQAQEQKKVMELEALFMQIRPHFLINTLNSIKCSLLLQKDQLHSGVIDSLMSLLRAYLKVNEPVTLQEECILLRHYIEIMQIRNGIELELDIELEAGLDRIVIPKLLLQPIVENAIVHGFEDVDDARITLRAWREKQWITIEIEDNGSGIEAGQLQILNQLLALDSETQAASYTRVGLMNIVQRLRLSFGQAAALELFSTESGTIATIRVPVNDVHALQSKE